MSTVSVDKQALYEWCRVSVEQLTEHTLPAKIPYRIVADSPTMGELMARDLLDDIQRANLAGRRLRCIVPCGPKSWYAPFVRLVNAERVSLNNVVVFHMDECLDWEGRLLPEGHPYNFRAFMEKHFYGGVRPELAVAKANRHFLTPANMEQIRELIAAEAIDVTIGGFGQDGHVAYNQTRRHPFSAITVEELRHSSIRIQDNNLDTVIALGQREFGGAYQFVPPMSITLGLKECLSAQQIRLYSDTGTWKQTAFRAALFSEETVEYPLTLLQSHPNALITVTRDTASHPIAEHPEWQFPGINA